jgi:TonB-dependent starch-binding outer membrane protein SusC
MKKEKRITKTKLLPLLMIAGLLCSFTISQAQSRKLTGQVLSEKGEPLGGVTVALKNSPTATITDNSGNYSLNASMPNPVLVFSYVNYKTKEIPVRKNDAINATLELKNASLNEVVVVGYGTVKKSDLTGSVVSLKAKDLTPGANISVEQTLQGRASGVQIYQKDGEPGGAMSIKIRGASSISAGNDPLYVIDGMPVNNLVPVSANGSNFPNNTNPRNPLNSLNPDDIASIEILKDASATAIYGSRGSNGVVIITTKKGKSGKLNVGYSGYLGQQKAANKLKLLTGTQYKDVLNSIIDDGGGVPSSRVTNTPVNTDWQQQLYQKAAVESHDLSFSGGKDNTRFYASLGYFNQDGVLKNSYVKRYTGRFNIENSVAKKYGFGLNFNTSYIQNKYNAVGLGVNENGSALYSAINYDPSYPIYDSSGKYFRSPFMTNIDHPVALSNGEYAVEDGFRTFGSIYGEYFILPSLSAKIRIAGDVNTSQRNTWIDPITLVGLQYAGVASINTGNINYYMGEATLNYNNQFGKDHNINAVIGATSENFGSNAFSGNGRGYALPDLTYNAIGTGDPLQNQIASGRASSKLISFLGRLNYTYKDKYLFTASFRADGSSRFGPNNRYGYFPSIALGWKLQDENFIKNIQFINELKLRMSYGSIGNQAIANYLYLATYAPGGRSAIFNNLQNTTLFPTRIPNPNLKWEAANQADIGIDFALFDRRLNGSLEYYNRKTSDLLLDLPVPLSTGYGFQTQNIGSMRNTGFDLAINGDIVRSKSFNWNLGIVFSTVKNTVLDLGPLSNIITGGAGFIANAAIIEPGKSLESYYGYKVLGVWQTNDDFSKGPIGVKAGDTKYLDLNGDGKIDANDRVILGKPIPDFTFGITNTFSYKRLSLAIFVEGSYGSSVINNEAIDSYFPIDFRRNRLAKPYLNRWTPENPTNEYPSFVNPTSQGQEQINSKTVEDASYLRLQSVRLSYDFNLQNRFIKSLQVFATGQNLFTITKYDGIDPAVNAIGDDILKIDYSTYPLARTFIFGVNVQF